MRRPHSALDRLRRRCAQRVLAPVALAALLVGAVNVGGSVASASAGRSHHDSVALHLVPFGPDPAAGLHDRQGPTGFRRIDIDFVLKASARNAVPVGGAERVTRWLREQGLDPSVVGSDVRVYADITSVALALRVRFSNFGLDGTTVYASTRPHVPFDIRQTLEAILGLSNAPAAVPSGAMLTLPDGPPRSRPTGGAAGAARSDSNSPAGSVTSCVAANDAAALDGSETLNAVGDHYGVGSLLGEGDKGAGVTVAVLELAPSVPSDIATYDSCFGLSSSNYSTDEVDGGGSTSAPGTFEADLDVEEVQTQAPSAHVVSYEGPNSLDGFYDTLQAIVVADTAKVISISWGTCESGGGLSWYDAMDGLLSTASSQGQTVFAATGDDGSEDCYEDSQEPSMLAVNYPASDPNVTAVGGTQWSGGADVVWNDCEGTSGSSCAYDADFEGAGGGAGGGGISTVFGQPLWQKASGDLSGRGVPDISAYAENNLAYYDASWTPGAGTSFAAPMLAGITADVVPTCATSIGDLAPRLYAEDAAYGYGTALSDVTRGDNDWTRGSGGADYPARSGYDLASGLGVPIATGLVCPSVSEISSASVAPGSAITITGNQLAESTVTFGSFGAGTITASSPTSLTVTVPEGSGTAPVSVASPIGAAAPVSFTYPEVSFESPDSTSFTLGQAGSFTVTTSGYSAPTMSESGNLPAGVSFSDHGNGTAALAGTPAAGAGGLYTVTLAASDASGTATQSFSLTVDASPVFTSADAASFTVGQPSAVAVQVAAYPSATLTESGALPSGINLAGGYLSGEPAGGTAGSYNITLAATNAFGTTQQFYTLSVQTGPVFTSAASAAFIVGEQGSSTLTTTGSAGTTITNDGGLPPGLVFTDSGTGTATISGTPAAGDGGVYGLNFQVSNGVGSTGDQSFTLNVYELPSIVVGMSLPVTTESSADYEYGQRGTIDLSVYGTPNPTISESGALPDGLSFAASYNPSSITMATLSGTALESGTFPITFTATNPGGSTDLAFTITVAAAPSPAVTSSTSTTTTTGPTATTTTSTVVTTQPVLTSTTSTTTTTVPEVPRVDLTQRSASVHGATVRVAVRCLVAECRGAIILSTKETRPVKGGRSSTRRSEVVIVGESHYVARAGSAILAKVTLDRTGRNDLAHAKGHLMVVLSVTVAGGLRVQRTIVLSLAKFISKAQPRKGANARVGPSYGLVSRV